MKIIYGTTNINKINEIKKYFADYDVDIISLKDVGFYDEIEENGTTFLENSMIKAKIIRQYCISHQMNYAVLTDDAGICIKELNNQPGIYTKRYASKYTTQELALNSILDKLKDKSDRAAKFYCALTFVYKDEYIQVEGVSEGVVAEKLGKMGGFTFGPIFIPLGYDRPYNELNDFKTHRHIAFEKLIKKLDDNKILSLELK